MALKQSPLHDRHVALGAKLAEFGGWEMPLEYPAGVIKEHTAVRQSVGIFDVSHLGKVVVRGDGAQEYVERDAEQRPRPDRPGPGAVHALLRRRHGRHRRRPDRLPARRRPPAAGAQRGEHGRGRPPARGRQARGRDDHRPPRDPRRARRAGHAVRRGARGRRAADRPRLHVLRGAPLRRRGRRRLPHRLHRRARLRAGRAQRGGAGPVGRPAPGGRGARHPALRPRRPRHAAHRDGLPAPRSGHLPAGHAQPGPPGLGRRLEEAGVLGPRRPAWRRRRRV